MLTEYTCDLHIHSCLSPCGDLDMYPQAIIEEALRKKINVIALCDHNASENVAYTKEAAATANELSVLAGMEITTAEEVHVLALFDNIGHLHCLQEIIYASLPGENDETVFGCQVIVDSTNLVMGFNEHLLMGATSLTMQEVIFAIHDLKGLAIAAHVDRESFGVFGQLGFIPPHIEFDALELSRHTTKEDAARRFPDINRYPVIRSSDAHYVRDIGSAVTKIIMERPTVVELKMAFDGKDGRSFRI